MLNREDILTAMRRIGFPRDKAERALVEANDHMLLYYMKLAGYSGSRLTQSVDVIKSEFQGQPLSSAPAEPEAPQTPAISYAPEAMTTKTFASKPPVSEPEPTEEKAVQEVVPDQDEEVAVEPELVGEYTPEYPVKFISIEPTETELEMTDLQGERIRREAPEWDKNNPQPWVDYVNQLLESGVSKKNIAEYLGVSRPTLNNRLK